MKEEHSDKKTEHKPLEDKTKKEEQTDKVGEQKTDKDNTRPIPEKEEVKREVKSVEPKIVEVKQAELKHQSKKVVEQPDIKNIDIALDSYDDLFSDFDISPFSRRILSEDFVIELMKRAPYERSSSTLQVVLSIPEKMRNPSLEKVIQRRIKQHFSKKVEDMDREISATQQKGLKYILAGLGIIVVLIFLQGNLPFNEALTNVLEVASWFGVWTGLSKIFDEPQDLVRTKNVYAILSNAHYIFVNEEEFTKNVGSEEDVK